MFIPMVPILFLILPTFIHCHIIIDIRATGSNTSSAIASGSIQDIISDQERQTFGITDEALKTAAERWSRGRPQDVFVRSPTPWNDLYTTYGWRQVTRILEPIKAKVVDVSSEPVIVATKEFANNSTTTGIFNAAIAREIFDTVNSTWDKNHVLTLGQPISYEIKMGLGNSSGETLVAYTSTWGNSVSESRKITVGSNVGVEIVLEPGQSVLSTMTVTRGSVVVEIDYAAKLSGSVACNYPKRYKGHHFWSYGVNNIMNALHLPVQLTSKERLRIWFYSNAQLVVNDLKSKKMLFDGPMEIYSHLK